MNDSIFSNDSVFSRRYKGRRNSVTLCLGPALSLPNHFFVRFIFLHNKGVRIFSKYDVMEKVTHSRFWPR